MANSMFDPRRYAHMFARALVAYTAVTIAVGIIAALVMAFLARPLVGLMLVGAFGLGAMTRAWVARSSMSMFDVLQEARAAAHTLF
jgi:hypothetical protein